MRSGKFSIWYEKETVPVEYFYKKVHIINKNELGRSNWNMKQYILVSVFVLSFLLYGCSAATEKEKIQDLEFTIISEENIPKELKDIIEEKKQGEFKLTYANDQDLYIVVGYGEQPTGGYSIEVPELYLAKENIIIDTNLIGPEGDAIVQTSYPYVVVKTEWREEPVLYQ